MSLGSPLVDTDAGYRHLKSVPSGDTGAGKRAIGHPPFRLLGWDSGSTHQLV